MSSHVDVTIPPGVAPGQDLRITLPNGAPLEFQVPQGVNAGDIIQVAYDDTASKLPAARAQGEAPLVPVQATAYPIEQHQPETVHLVAAAAPRQQPGSHVVVMQTTTRGHAPPGVPEGGRYKSVKFFGPISLITSIVLGVFLFIPCAFIPCCAPCDNQEIYIGPDGRKYDSNGNFHSTQCCEKD